MGKIKAVFFDIDGTLVSFKTHRIPQSTLDAVAALRSRGIKVYIATGRPVPFIDNLGELEYDGMITVTGAHCFTRGGEIIFHRAVSTGSVERVVEHLTHGTDAYPVIFVCSDEMFITELNEDVDAVARLLDIKMPTVRPASYARGKDDVTMLSHVPYGIAMGNACDELKRVSAYVTDSVDEDGVEKALRHFGLID